MSETFWANRNPGDVVVQGSEDPTMLLLGADAPPDWVLLPEELGGHRVRVVAAFRQQCPTCKDGVLVQHLEVHGGLFVAECLVHKFQWYRRTK